MLKLTQEELTRLFKTKIDIARGATLITGEAFIDKVGENISIYGGQIEWDSFLEEHRPLCPIACDIYDHLVTDCINTKKTQGKVGVIQTWFYSHCSLTYNTIFRECKEAGLNIPVYAFIHAYYLDYALTPTLKYDEGVLPDHSVLRYMPPREEVDTEELRQWIETAQQGSAEPPEWLKSFPFVPLKKDRLEPPPYIDEAPIGDSEAVEAIDLSDLERTYKEAEEATEGQLKPRASDPKEQAAPKLVFPNGVSVDLIMRCLDQKSPDYLGNLDVVIRLIDKRHKGEFETPKAKRLGVRHQIKCARAFEELIQNELGLNGTTAEIRGDSCRRVAFPADWIPDK